MKFSEIESIIKDGSSAMIKRYESLKDLQGISSPKEYHFTGTPRKILEELQNNCDKQSKNVIYIFSTEKLPALCKNAESIKTKFEEINSRSRCMPAILNLDFIYLYI